MPHVRTHTFPQRRSSDRARECARSLKQVKFVQYRRAGAAYSDCTATQGAAMVHELFPYLHVNNAAQAIAFYQQAFGVTEIFRLTEPGGRIGHAERSEEHTSELQSLMRSLYAAFFL